MRPQCVYFLTHFYCAKCMKIFYSFPLHPCESLWYVYIHHLAAQVFISHGILPHAKVDFKVKRIRFRCLYSVFCMFIVDDKRWNRADNQFRKKNLFFLRTDMRRLFVALWLVYHPTLIITVAFCISFEFFEVDYFLSFGFSRIFNFTNLFIYYLL